MKQPVLVILEVPDDTDFDQLGTQVERALRSQAFQVRWAIPVQRTDGVPAGAITHAS